MDVYMEVTEDSMDVVESSIMRNQGVNAYPVPNTRSTKQGNPNSRILGTSVTISQPTQSPSNSVNSQGSVANQGNFFVRLHEPMQ